ncbi:ciliary microtubule inner protein 2B [Pagrus major]|uniref:ciliary microtubule inner protein 2B n=1 Tax=Pagrus major TaxID=143350 RepID=UPI003CC85D69
MDKYAPKFSKVLVTADPHYIPGYTGYCPQLKYTMGKSYSQLTAELLTSPDVNHSSHLVLHSGHVPSAGSNTLMSPVGVSGFIPRSQNYFACSYSEARRKALSEFYQERRSRIQRQSSDPPAVAKNSSQQFERPKPPLIAMSNHVIDYKPLKPFTAAGKPYSMDDDDPRKYFISGFTGHVPKSRFLMGKSYPMITNEALIQFGKQQQSDPNAQDFAERRNSTITPLPTINPANRGVVPSFTGHIPGYKFMYGHTFGQLSKIALEKSDIEGQS